MLKVRWLTITLLFFGCINIVIAQNDSLIQLQEVEIIKYNPYDLVNPDFIFSEIKKTFAASVQQVDLYLSLYTNASIKRYGPNGFAAISLDGLHPQHTQVFWNGIPVNTSILGITDISLYPFTSDLVVDIIKSSDSYRYTGSQLGGTVIMENRLISQNRIGITFQNGSYSFWSAAFNATKYFKDLDFKVGIDVGYQTAMNDYKFQDYANSPIIEQSLKDADYHKIYLLPSVEWSINSSHVYRFNGLYTQNKRNLTASIVSPNNQAKHNDNIVRLSNSWEFQDKKLENKLNIGYAFDQLSYEERSGNNLNIASQYNVHKLVVNQTFGWNNKTHEFKTGGNLLMDFAKGSQIPNTSIRQGGIFSLYKLHFRSGFYHLESVVRSDFHSEESHGFGGNLSIIAQPLKKFPVKLKVSGIRNIKYPSINELYLKPSGNADLKKETSWQINVEIYSEKKFELGGHNILRMQNTMEAYSIWLDDMIIWVPTNKIYWQPINLLKVHSWGIKQENTFHYTNSQKNITVIFSRLHHLAISTNKANSKDQNPLFPNDLTIGKQLPYIPKQSMKFNLYLEFKGVFLNIHANYLSRRFITGSNSYYLQKYWMLDTGVGYNYITDDFHHNFSIEFALKNSLNNQYYQEIAHIPMPGRNYQITVKYGFQK